MTPLHALTFSFTVRSIETQYHHLESSQSVARTEIQELNKRLSTQTADMERLQVYNTQPWALGSTVTVLCCGFLG